MTVDTHDSGLIMNLFSHSSPDLFQEMQWHPTQSPEPGKDRPTVFTVEVPPPIPLKASKRNENLPNMFPPARRRSSASNALDIPIGPRTISFKALDEDVRPFSFEPHASKNFNLARSSQNLGSGGAQKTQEAFDTDQPRKNNNVGGSSNWQRISTDSAFSFGHDSFYSDPGEDVMHEADPKEQWQADWVSSIPPAHPNQLFYLQTAPHSKSSFTLGTPDDTSKQPRMLLRPLTSSATKLHLSLATETKPALETASDDRNPRTLKEFLKQELNLEVGVSAPSTAALAAQEQQQSDWKSLDDTDVGMDVEIQDVEEIPRRRSPDDIDRDYHEIVRNLASSPQKSPHKAQEPSSRFDGNTSYWSDQSSDEESLLTSSGGLSAIRNSMISHIRTSSPFRTANLVRHASPAAQERTSTSSPSFHSTSPPTTTKRKRIFSGQINPSDFDADFHPITSPPRLNPPPLALRSTPNTERGFTRRHRRNSLKRRMTDALKSWSTDTQHTIKEWSHNRSASAVEQTPKYSRWSHGRYRRPNTASPTFAMEPISSLPVRPIISAPIPLQTPNNAALHSTIKTFPLHVLRSDLNITPVGLRLAGEDDSIIGAADDVEDGTTSQYVSNYARSPFGPDTPRPLRTPMSLPLLPIQTTTPPINFSNHTSRNNSNNNSPPSASSKRSEIIELSEALKMRPPTRAAISPPPPPPPKVRKTSTLSPSREARSDAAAEIGNFASGSRPPMMRTKMQVPKRFQSWEAEEEGEEKSNSLPSTGSSSSTSRLPQATLTNGTTTAPPPIVENADTTTQSRRRGSSSVSVSASISSKLGSLTGAIGIGTLKEKVGGRVKMIGGGGTGGGGTGGGEKGGGEKGGDRKDEEVVVVGRETRQERERREREERERKREMILRDIFVVGLSDQGPDGRVSSWL